MDEERTFGSAGDCPASEALAPEPSASSPAVSSAAWAGESEANTSLAADKGADMSPWTRNELALTAIFPREVWNMILDLAPDAARYVLRQSCRFFFQLIFDYHVRHWRAETPIRGATVPYNVKEVNDRNALKSVMERQVFCAACLAFRKSGAYDRKIEELARPLYCDGCRKDHPAILFSARLRRSLGRRVCIGREGSVPLCDHDVQLHWKDVAELTSYHCMDSSHLDPSTSHRHFLSALEVIRAPKHWGPVLYGYLPVLKLVRVRWKLCAFELSSRDEHLTSAMLQDKMQKFATRVHFKPCPHLSFGDGSLLRPFDPVYCSCVGEVPPLYHSPRLCSIGLSDMRKCCLCQEWWEKWARAHGGDGGIGEDRSAIADTYTVSLAGTEETMTGSIPDDEPIPPKPFLALSESGIPCAHHRGCCTDCHASYHWSREGPDGRCVVLSYDWELHLRLDEPTERVWIDALDPESYGRDTDEDGKHVFWCDDVRCATSYKGRGHAKAINKALAVYEAKGKEEAAEMRWADYVARHLVGDILYEVE